MKRASKKVGGWLHLTETQSLKDSEEVDGRFAAWRVEGGIPTVVGDMYMTSGSVIFCPTRLTLRRSAPQVISNSAIRSVTFTDDPSISRTGPVLEIVLKKGDVQLFTARQARRAAELWFVRSRGRKPQPGEVGSSRSVITGGRAIRSYINARLQTLGVILMVGAFLLVSTSSRIATLMIVVAMVGAVGRELFGFYRER